MLAYSSLGRTESGTRDTSCDASVKASDLAADRISMALWSRHAPPYAEFPLQRGLTAAWRRVGALSLIAWHRHSAAGSPRVLLPMRLERTTGLGDVHARSRAGNEAAVGVGGGASHE